MLTQQGKGMTVLKQEITVREMITNLLEYNLDAIIAPLAHNKKQPFSFCIGGADGGTKHDCDEVFIECTDLNQDERTGQ
jgi:hypothetical protein